VLVLHLQADCHEGLLSLGVVGATLANELVCKNALIQVLDHFLFLLSLHEGFNPINGHVEEFIDILLDHGINGRAINVLESHAELLGIEVLSLDLH
jgi:hypothetical protein